MKPVSVVIQADWVRDSVYGPNELEVISNLTEPIGQPVTKEMISQSPGMLREVECIFGTWGMPVLSNEFLKWAPNLKAIFYAAGDVSGFVTDALFESGITLCCAEPVNAIPVAEFSVANIILALKRTHYAHRVSYTHGRFDSACGAANLTGGYQSRVGLVSLGHIGRLVAALLKPFDVEVIAHDPFIDPCLARSIGVSLHSLEDVFNSSHVISLHTPLNECTRMMIDEELLQSMRKGASLINTSRGGLIDQNALVSVLEKRDDLQAILDVTEPEPLPSNSRLWRLPNVFLSPHVAGSVGKERYRMAHVMIEECRRFLKDMPLKYQFNGLSCTSSQSASSA